MYCLNGRLTLAYMKPNSLDILDLPQVELKIFHVRKWEAKDFKSIDIPTSAPLILGNEDNTYFKVWINFSNRIKILYWYFALQLDSVYSQYGS